MGRFTKKTPDYLPDGPIMSCLREPQLMYVKSKRSTYMMNKYINNEIQREWKNMKLPKTTCCGRYIKSD